MMEGVSIVMFHWMLMNRFVMGWWSLFVWMLNWMLCFVPIAFVIVEVMFTKRRMVITEPEFVAMSRVMVSERSESEIRCVIVITGM